MRRKVICIGMCIMIAMSSIGCNPQNSEAKVISNSKNEAVQVEIAQLDESSEENKTEESIGITEEIDIVVEDITAIGCDKDLDGLMDAEDIVEGARIDRDNKPSYISEYYAGGYPPDDKGVCTDVVSHL